MMMGIFDNVGILTNVNKMAVMVCQIYWMYGVHLEEDYTRRMLGVGPSVQERQRESFRCPYFVEDLAAGLLVAHS